MKKNLIQQGKKYIVASGLAALLLVSTIVGTLIIQGAESEKTEFNNPVIQKTADMESGQKVTWDCIWFGSYPQTEIIASDSVYSDLKNASWNVNGDAIVRGEKYRRLKKSDALLAVDGKDSYYNWSDDSTYHYFKYEPIKWRILEVKENQLMLVSDMILDAQKYSTVVGNITWEKSNLRSWLNGYGSGVNQSGTDYSKDNFISAAFTKEEQELIANTKVVNQDNYSFGRDGGLDTTDKLFLLSESEVYTGLANKFGFVSDFLTNDEARRCKSSDYAKARGTWYYTNYGYEGNGDWLLRSPGGDRSVTYINHYGYVENLGCYVHEAGKGVRVAMNLNLTDSTIKLNAGVIGSDGALAEVKPDISQNETGKPTQESTTKPAQESTTKPAQEGTTKPAQEGTTKPTQETESSENIETTKKPGTQGEEETTEPDKENETPTQQKPSVSPVNAQKPVIKKQPSDKTYSYGKKADIFDCTATVSDGGKLSYQWYVKSSKNGKAGKVSGGATKNYRPSTAKAGVKYYYCVIKNTNNSATGKKTVSVTTKTIKVTVNKLSNRVRGVKSKYSKKLGQKRFVLKAKAKGTVRYRSSNPKVVKVNAKTGKVTIKGVGKAYIYIKAGNAKYKTVTKKVRIYVRPKTHSIKKLKSPKSKTLQVNWKKASGITGYKIQYSDNPSFKGAKTVTVSGKNRTSKTIKGLKSGKKYYVRIRTYKKVRKLRYYSKWSKVKTCEIR